MLNGYNATRLYSTGAYDYIVKYSNDRYLVTLTYDSNDRVETIIVSMLVGTDDTRVPVDSEDKLFESFKKDLTKRCIEFKINGNIINIEYNLN